MKIHELLLTRSTASYRLNLGQKAILIISSSPFLHWFSWWFFSFLGLCISFVKNSWDSVIINVTYIVEIRRLFSATSYPCSKEFIHQLESVFDMNEINQQKMYSSEIITIPHCCLTNKQHKHTHINHEDFQPPTFHEPLTNSQVSLIHIIRTQNKYFEHFWWLIKL